MSSRIAPVTRRAVAWRPLVYFLLIAFGLSWLFTLPLWLGGGLTSGWFLPCSLAMMATPAIAALVVSRWVARPASIPYALGLSRARPAGRFILFLALGLVLPVFLVMAALVVGNWAGVYPADFVNFSGYAQLLDLQAAQAGVPMPDVPIGVLVAAQFINVVIGAVINLVPAMGEELGWRGWLLPALQPLGVWPAMLATGIIWGVWHAPLLLLGYNYPDGPGWLAIVAMCGMCVTVGTVFGWLRLRSKSIWPAAVAHAALNASSGLMIIFVQANGQFSTFTATILGVTGWIVPVVLIAVLALTGQFSRARLRLN